MNKAVDGLEVGVRICTILIRECSHALPHLRSSTCYAGLRIDQIQFCRASQKRLDMMKSDRLHWNLCAIVVILLLAASSLNGVAEAAASPPTLKLRFGHYGSTVCKNVESVVRAEVLKKSQQDFTIIPALLRIYFHDCFADHQCDASLLIKKMPSGAKTELDAGTNEGIRGLDFIDFLKTKVLTSCGGANLVSCADIIALATRDAVAIASGRVPYAIPTGRLDGKLSAQANANSLPGSRNSISTLVTRFQTAGFSAEDTVILSGAHSIGQSRCKFFNDRLYKFSITKKPDPTMSVALANQLRKVCSNSTADNNRVFLDQGTSVKFDKSYFTQITQSRGVLQSDQNLLVSTLTKGFVNQFAAGTEDAFGKKFEAAMVRLGSLGNLTGSNGNIRKVCSVLN